jgi:AcrR family transcriptional regulator
MHYMADSAVTGVRERRMAQTRFQLTACARRLTAELGLNGFTVEEVCEDVGVSRRTFFNYFRTKEEAVVGHSDDFLEDASIAAFLASRPPATVGISPTLLHDLAAIAIANVEAVAPDADQARSFMAAVAKEPKLLSSFMRSGAENERTLAQLVARREGLSPEDPMATVVVTIFGALVRRSYDQFFTIGNTTPFAELIHTNLTAARTVFSAEQASRSSHFTHQGLHQ